MADKTNIAWSDSTFNGWIGCTAVSTACRICYANTLDDNRFSKTLGGEPPKNVHIGVTVENQEMADLRIPQLLAIPAHRRFLSCEPLLSDIDLSKWFWELPDPICANCPKDVDCECGFKTAKENGRPSIDQVIVGGESGPGYRPLNLEWMRSIKEQCSAAGVAYFSKQDSGPRPGMRGRIPDDLLVQEETR